MKSSYIVFLCAFLFDGVSLGAAACSAYERGLSEEDKRIIVDKHNELRRSLAEGKIAGQPKGFNFKEIKYDETLGSAAQRISDSCVFAHQQVSDNRWHAVGQNLYTSMSTAYNKGADWSSAIKSWADEHVHYKYGGPINSQNGHYTQMVWANTEYIGCGYTFYAANDFYKYKKLYTCNYGPAGNYIGQNPYSTGSTRGARKTKYFWNNYF